MNQILLSPLIFTLFQTTSISLVEINMALYNSKVYMKNIFNAENFFVFNTPYYYHTMNKKIALKLKGEKTAEIDVVLLLARLFSYKRAFFLFIRS